MYAHVENGQLTYRGELPKSWRNISGLNKSEGDSAFLKPLGWFPLKLVPATPGDTDLSDGEEISLLADSVTITEKIRPMTDEELATYTSNLLQSSIEKLDGSITTRRLVSAILNEAASSGNDNLGGAGWLARQEGLIAAERSKKV